MPFIWLAPAVTSASRLAPSLRHIFQPHRHVVVDLIAGQAARAVVVAIGILRRDREVRWSGCSFRPRPVSSVRRTRLSCGLVLAASAAAAVGALVVTPALTVATSGAARTSPWPVMDNGTGARIGGESRGDKSGGQRQTQQNTVFHDRSLSKSGAHPATDRVGENRGEIEAVGGPENPVIPPFGRACSSVG